MEEEATGEEIEAASDVRPLTWPPVPEESPPSQGGG